MDRIIKDIKERFAEGYEDIQVYGDIKYLLAALTTLEQDNAKLQDRILEFLDGETEIQKENALLRSRLKPIEECHNELSNNPQHIAYIESKTCLSDPDSMLLSFMFNAITSACEAKPLDGQD